MKNEFVTKIFFSKAVSFFGNEIKKFKFRILSMIVTQLVEILRKKIRFIRSSDKIWVYSFSHLNHNPKISLFI